MSEPVARPEELRGTEVIDQAGGKLGPVCDLYAPGGEGEPMWVAIELREGLAGGRRAIVPLARLKVESGAVTVPYSFQHIQQAPTVDAGGEIAPEDDRRLREYYGIGRGDEPEREKNPDLYSTRVRPEGEPSQRLAP